MIRRLLVAALVLVLPAVAFAKRQQVTAKTAGVLRAEASDSGKEVAKVAAGDKLTVLTTKDGWVNVATTTGKKGWVPAAVVPDVKMTSSTVNTGSTTTVAAAEGSTAAAMRGRPGTKKRTVVVGDAAAIKEVGEALRANPKLDVIDADYVVIVRKADDGSLQYELADLKKGETSVTKTATSPADLAKDVGAATAPTN